MRQTFGYSIASKLLLLFLIANVSADERLKRQAGTTIRRWALNTVYYYFDPSLTTAQQTLANRVMKSIIQPSTCISFVMNATARNRVKIVSDPSVDWCESSKIGCKGGEQTITMGSKCIYDGAFAKAIFHVLGFYTMERRSDRDNFVNINSNSVDPAMTDGLAIINSTYSTNLLGYNFGSVIHSAYDMFVYEGSTDYPILPKDNAYFYTMGGPIVTSYDLNMLNQFYYCNNSCPNPTVTCTNSGTLNTRSCNTCNCPLGYAGTTCNTRPADGGQQLTATTSWTSLTVTITGSASLAEPGPYSTKTYWIVKPAGYSYVQFQYVSFSSTQTTFSPGCRDFGLELKYQSNQQLANPRVCSDAWNGLSSSSPLATTPIVAYTGTISATFVLQFRATNTNVTDIRSPPPPFPSLTTSTSTSTSMPTTTTTIDCFANSAPLAQCAAQCPTGWTYVNGKCYQYFGASVECNIAAATCGGLCPMCHLPRVYSRQQGLDLYSYVSTNSGFNPWADIRKIATDPTGMSVENSDDVGYTCTFWDTAFGQPSNAPGKDCVYIQNNGLWADYPCDFGVAPYACETDERLTATCPPA